MKNITLFKIIFLTYLFFPLACEKTNLNLDLNNNSQSQTKYFNEYSCDNLTPSLKITDKTGSYDNSPQNINCKPIAQIWHINMPNKEWCFYTKQSSELNSFNPSQSQIFRQNSLSPNALSEAFQIQGDERTKTTAKLMTILGSATAVSCLGSGASIAWTSNNNLKTNKTLVFAKSLLSLTGGVLCGFGTATTLNAWQISQSVKNDRQTNIVNLKKEAQGTQNQAGSFNNDSTMMKILKDIPPTPNAVSCPPVDKAIEIYKQQVKT